MNACAYCKNRKRKCDKRRPACSNCIRLHRACVYREDAVQINFPHSLPGQQITAGGHAPTVGNVHTFGLPASRFVHPIWASGSINHISLPIIDLTVRAEALRILGSFDKLSEIAAGFFVGMHQRISILSKSRFYKNFQSINSEPKADFLTLCLCIYLIEQIPTNDSTSMQSTLYVSIKSLLGMFEATEQVSLDFVQARTFVACYEIGHGLHTAARISVAACAKTARVLGLHKRRSSNDNDDGLIVEEERRTWWAIVNMDRFVGLYSGDILFSTEDPQGLDPLPVEDLLWSQDGDLADLRASILDAPMLATPPNRTVGQMARECQVSHLAGRVIRHTTSPTSDPNFNAEEAVQLERTLQTILLLLIDEDLTYGRYCGALGICDRRSALFTLYEFLLGRCNELSPERARILDLMQELSERAATFAEAGYADKETFSIETLSPFLPYCLYQAGIVQYRMWRQKGDLMHKVQLDALTNLLKGNGKRWAVATIYLDILEKLCEDWPPIVLPPYSFYFKKTSSIS